MSASTAQPPPKGNPNGAMEKLLMALSLEKLDKDLFRSVLLWTPENARGTFGGQLVAHSVEAAHHTIPDAMVIHSVHCYFLHGGNSQKPIYYRVRRMRDGKSMAVRMIVAQQEGQPIFVANASFHIKEKAGISHQPRFPSVPPPEQGRSEKEFMESLMSEVSEGKRFRQDMRRKMSREAAPVQMRYLQRGTPKRPIKSNRPSHTWVKVDLSQEQLDAVPRVHLLLACWLSDFTLALAGLQHHGSPNPDVQMLVSLDHTIYFHQSDFVVSDWFLYEVFSHWADNNRALNTGKIYSKGGRLEMTVVQESLVRMTDGYYSVAKL